MAEWSETGDRQSEGAGGSLKEIYHRYFSAVPATTGELLRQVYSIRYQVYCLERQFEEPDPENPEQEIDEFDGHSVHSLLIHKPRNEIAGAVRLVLPKPESNGISFPIQTVCSDPILRDPARFPVQEVGEISRFCISKNFRRRERDRFYAEDVSRPSAGDTTRIIPHLTLGLMEQVVSHSGANGIRYVCAEMEPALLRLLSRLGIHFEPIGAPVNYHGVRQPCMARLDRLLDRVRAERPDVWEVITDNGRHTVH